MPRHVSIDYIDVMLLITSQSYHSHINVCHRAIQRLTYLLPYHTSFSDDCSPSPCLNGAVCQDEVNTYTCDCLDGYEGAQCQTTTACPSESEAVCPGCIQNYREGGVLCTCQMGYSTSKRYTYRHNIDMEIAHSKRDFPLV